MYGAQDKIDRQLAGIDQLEVYDDGTYQYRCFAQAGAKLADKSWRVSRVHKTTGQVRFPQLNGICDPDYHFAATSLEVVAAYNYNLPT
jgi:hypothetical protein